MTHLFRSTLRERSETFDNFESRGFGKFQLRMIDSAEEMNVAVEEREGVRWNRR